MNRPLTQWFGSFLHRRRVAHHFGRHALGDMLGGHGPASAVPHDMARELLQAARAEPTALFMRLRTQVNGLTQSEATAQRDGPNEVLHEKPLSAWLHPWHCYRNPFNLLLTVLALVSYLGAEHPHGLSDKDFDETSTGMDMP